MSDNVNLPDDNIDSANDSTELTEDTAELENTDKKQGLKAFLFLIIPVALYFLATYVLFAIYPCFTVDGGADPEWSFCNNPSGDTLSFILNLVSLIFVFTVFPIALFKAIKAIIKKSGVALGVITAVLSIGMIATVPFSFWPLRAFMTYMQDVSFNALFM